MWKQIYNKLKTKGLNPYPPGKHKGECNKPYTVILAGETIPSYNTRKHGQQVIDIVFFYPIKSYIAGENYKNEVKKALAEIEWLRSTGRETATITDDDKKAYTSSINYVIQKKLEV